MTTEKLEDPGETTSGETVTSGSLTDDDRSPTQSLSFGNSGLDTQTQDTNLTFTTTEKVKDSSMTVPFNVTQVKNTGPNSNSSDEATRSTFPLNLSMETFITGAIIIILASVLTCCFLWKLFQKRKKPSVFPSRANVSSVLRGSKITQIDFVILDRLLVKNGINTLFCNLDTTLDLHYHS
jgi:hypothetical protein